MLKMEFTAEVYEGGDGEKEARGIVAALIEIYGGQIVPASYTRVGQLERATGPVTINVSHTGDPAETVAAIKAAAGLAADGEPMAPAPAGNVDSAGTPWDERIHASTKTTNKDGTWTRRRNTPDEVFNAVMAELKGASTTPPAPEPEPTAAEAFTPPPAVVIAPTVPPVPQATTVAPPPAPAPVIPAPAAGGVDFVTIMRTITAKQQAGELDKPKLDGILQTCGLDNLGKLAAADEATRSAVMAMLSA